MFRSIGGSIRIHTISILYLYPEGLLDLYLLGLVALEGFRVSNDIAFIFAELVGHID